MVSPPDGRAAADGGLWSLKIVVRPKTPSIPSRLLLPLLLLPLLLLPLLLLLLLVLLPLLTLPLLSSPFAASLGRSIQMQP